MYENTMYIEALEENGAVVSIHLYQSYYKWTTLYYAINNTTNWTKVSGGKEYALEQGDKMYIKGNNTTFGGTEEYTYFTIQEGGNVHIGGNIMGLLDDGACTTTSLNCGFYKLFQNCTKIVSVDSGFLPATTLLNYCYQSMFYGCTSLTQAPELPATTLTEYCYQAMFDGCTSLKIAPSLPATTLANDCYGVMFRGCTSLTTPPVLPATTLANYCYQGMFQGCTSLTQAPALPATTLTEYCYRDMFKGCTSLTTAPELPATTLTDHCYNGMFSGCKSLINAPVLHNTTLAGGCYKEMFYGCTSLTQAPELPATTLTNNCYEGMFQGCTSLTKSPVLPATTLTYACYNMMFYGCTSLNKITMLATNISADNSLVCWVNFLPSTGTFIKSSDLSTETIGRGDNGIPVGWDIRNYLGNMYIEALEDNGAIVSVKLMSSVSLQYAINNTTNWSDIVSNREYALEYGDKMYIKGNNAALGASSDSNSTHFTINGGNVHLGGNIMGLLDNGACDTTSIESSFCFRYLFSGCTKIVSVDSGFLPATTLSTQSYFTMFAGCTSLTNAPELPATTLGTGCYSGMFMNCSSLTEAPVLPATTLCTSCYSHMFYRCTSLTTTPALPATTLTNNCYEGMFQGCTSLVSVNTISATTLAMSCYTDMFKGCVLLTNVPDLPATTLAMSCYQGMFQGCTSLTTAPALPATNLTMFCYDGMFYGCTSLVTPPALPATTLQSYCYNAMFRGCTSLTQAPTLAATTLASNCYNAMFYGCTSLNRIYMNATDISASDCLTNWVSNVSSTGTFTKNSDLSTETIGRGVSGIPEGWTIEEYSPTPPVVSATVILRGSNCTLYIDDYSGRTEISHTFRNVFEEPTIKVVPDDGYNFISWSDGSLTNERTIELALGDNVYEATVEQGDYVTVTCAENPNCVVTGTGRKPSGSSYLITAYPSTGYVFNYWTLNSRKVTSNPWEMLEVGGDMNISVTVSKIKCTLSLYGNNCTLTGAGTYDYGTVVNVVCTPNTGYSFKRWDDGVTTASRSITITGDTVLVATTEEIPVQYYTVTIDPSTHCTVTGGGTYKEHSNVVLTCLPDDGYKFSKWLMNNSRYMTGNPLNYNDITESFTAKAIVEEVTRYTVALICINGSVYGAGTYNAGTTVTISCEPDTNYSFVQWSDGNTNRTRNITVNSNISLEAVVEYVEPTTEYSVVIDTNPNCRVTGTGLHFLPGDYTDLYCIPNDGYRFNKWTLKIGSRTITSSSNPYEILEIGSNITGSVEVIKQYTVALNGSNCTLSGIGTYDIHTVVTIKCEPNDGYVFVKWSDDNTNSERSFIITKDYNLTAIVEEYVPPTDKYTVTILSNENCTITGTGEYEEGDEVTLTCVPKAGYDFNRWMLNNRYVKMNPYKFEMGNVNVNGLVQLTRLSTVTITLTGNNCTLTGGGTYSSGSDVTIVCIPYSGYKFDNWSDGNVNPKRTFTNVTEDLVLIASVSPIETPTGYSVSIASNPNCTVTGTGDSFAPGSSTSLTAYPKSGYKFDKWIIDGRTMRSNPIEIDEINRNITGVVYVTEDTVSTYTVSIPAQPNCTISGSGNYVAGSTVTLTCTPNAGYKFSKWYLNGKYYTDNPIVIPNIQGNITGSVQLKSTSITTNYTISSLGKYDMLYNKYSDDVKDIEIMNTGEKYTFDNCNANYVLYYKNDLGGYDALACSGKVVKKDDTERFTINKAYQHNKIDFGKVNYKNSITESWKINTGYLTDFQSSRMHHLINSTEVYLHILSENTVIPVLISDTSVEYKTFKNNGRKFVSYTINVENSQTKFRN